MAMIILLGPYKRHIKASSDVHLTFFIVLSDSRKGQSSLSSDPFQNRSTADRHY